MSINLDQTFITLFKSLITKWKQTNNIFSDSCYLFTLFVDLFWITETVELYLRVSIEQWDKETLALHMT